MGKLPQSPFFSNFYINPLISKLIYKNNPNKTSTFYTERFYYDIKLQNYSFSLIFHVKNTKVCLIWIFL